MKKILGKIVVTILALTGVLGLVGIGCMLTTSDDQLYEEQVQVAKAIIDFKSHLPFRG